MQWNFDKSALKGNVIFSDSSKFRLTKVKLSSMCVCYLRNVRRYRFNLFFFAYYLRDECV